MSGIGRLKKRGYIPWQNISILSWYTIWTNESKKDVRDWINRKYRTKKKIFYIKLI